MGIFDRYSNSHFSDEHNKYGDFVISSVSKNDLDRFNINMTVKDFKNKVKGSKNYKIVLTGGGGNYRKTKVYNYFDFKNLK